MAHCSKKAEKELALAALFRSNNFCALHQVVGATQYQPINE
jgi:hypothetical protein